MYHAHVTRNDDTKASCATLFSAAMVAAALLYCSQSAALFLLTNLAHVLRKLKLSCATNLAHALRKLSHILSYRRRLHIMFTVVLRALQQRS